MTDRDYQHSRILDVHRWSEHQEANLFVDEVYDTFLNRQEQENIRIKKKHLKVVLLDLYVAWLNDPDLNIAVHMSPAAYSNGTVFSSGKSRYNELNIKVSTIDIVHRLDEAGLIGRKDGWKDSGGKGFLTRIWPTPKWMKTTIGGDYVVHGLRHSLRDRLRAVECPSDIIDQIGGWTTTGIGHAYGKGYSVEILAKWMQKIEC